MSPEFLPIRDSYCKYLDMSNDEKEVLMTLANMKYGTANKLRIPRMMEADGK
jgi:hypothetical protein